ncbi:MAG: F0F1 ATP synthase subunit epsilon [Bdellovibrionota bacterium]
MDSTFKLEIVTPNGAVFSGDAEELLAPGAMGEFGILPNHTLLVAALDSGSLAIRQGGKYSYYAVHGGFCQVGEGGKTVILADRIERAENIDKARAEAARLRAEERLKKIAFTDADYAETAAALQRAKTRLTVSAR